VRFIAVAVASAFLLMPFAAPVQAGSASGLSAAQEVELSAAKKKKAKKAKAKKEEYLRAVPVR
jgi:hypothetical protein